MLVSYLLKIYRKFGDGDGPNGPNLCTVKKYVGSTFIENTWKNRFAKIFLFRRKYSIVLASFRKIHFRQKNAKFREVCQVRKKAKL